ncbi:MAG: ROK family protein [Archangiaceae bacterium]|nr:ROK family protein [Archangiaceae bacterium]
MRVLVVDIGGSNVKLKGPRVDRLKFRSGKWLTPEKLLQEIKLITDGWRYDAVSIGFPGVVKRNRILQEPPNLAPGWLRFDFEKAFHKPVKIVNDAAMQALGSAPKSGITLFLGLGTGLGVSIVHDGHVIATELGEAHVHSVSKAALKRDGKKVWISNVQLMVEDFDRLIHPDRIIIGGGSVTRLVPFRKIFPNPNIIAGHNDHAFQGGVMLWKKVTHR